MNYKLALEIAITHLITRKKQTFVALLGVMLGISMFIIMISFMTGVNNFMGEMAMDGSPHVRIYNPLLVNKQSLTNTFQEQEGSWYVIHHQRPKNDLPKIRNALHIASRIEAMDGVDGVAPLVSSQVFFNNGPIQIPGTVSGIDIKRHKELFNLESKMDIGSLDDLLKSANSIVMGRGLADKSGVRVGDKVSITTPEGNTLLLRVVGIFSYGLTNFDDSKSYATIPTVQKILSRDPAYITELYVKLSDYRTAEDYSKSIHEQFDVYTEDWQAANSSLLAGDKIRYTMTAIVSFTLLMVAGFGIYNIMNMNIIHKMKDIAILKATGFEGKDIAGIFLFQSILIGIMGGILGLLLGYGGSYLISIAPFPEAGFLRLETLPVNFNPVFYITGFLFGVITTLFAGFFPSLRASKVDPVHIIRG